MLPPSEDDKCQNQTYGDKAVRYRWARSKDGRSWEARGQTGNGSWMVLEGRVKIIWKNWKMSFQAVRYTDGYQYIDEKLYDTRTDAMRSVEECDGLEFAKHATADDIAQIPMISQRDLDQHTKRPISNTRMRPGSNARR